MRLCPSNLLDPTDALSRSALGRPLTKARSTSPNRLGAKGLESGASHARSTEEGTRMNSHTRRFLVPLAVALMAISVPTGLAHAVLVLDQVFDPGPMRVGSVLSGVSLGIPKAQTFTVGLAGTLARVDVD